VPYFVYDAYEKSATAVDSTKAFVTKLVGWDTLGSEQPDYCKELRDAVKDDTDLNELTNPQATPEQDGVVG
jgi:hypothetical protein